MAQTRKTGLPGKGLNLGMRDVMSPTETLTPGA